MNGEEITKTITRCDRCREKTGIGVVRTIVTLESANGDELVMEICDDCLTALKLWMYGNSCE